MSRIVVNGVDIAYELIGTGPTIALVHGSWVDHTSWQLVAPTLSTRYQVLVYDRRGHSASERPVGPSARRVHEDDLIGLIEALHLAPAHLVGNSYGGSICLGVTARRPDLVRSVTAHEPPLLDIAQGVADLVGCISAARRVIGDVAAAIAGDAYGEAAELFVDLVLGAGAWSQLPDDSRRIMIANAPTVTAMLDADDWAAAPMAADATVPVMITDGDRSPDWLRGTARAFAADIPHAYRHTFAGAGHAPHLTHPVDFLASLDATIGRTSSRAAQSARSS